MGKTLTEHSERQTKGAEVRPGTPEAGLNKYKKKNEKLQARPNVKAAEAIRQLRGDLEVKDQQNGIAALDTALVNVLTKLAKNGEKILEIESPGQLEELVNKHKLQGHLPPTLPETEEVAIQRLNEIIKQPGETSLEIRNSWRQQKLTALEASKGWDSKYMEYWQKHPFETGALHVAGAAALYLTFDGLMGLVDKLGGDEKDEAGQKKKGSRRKRMLIGVGIMALGAILGWDAAKKLASEMGLDIFDLQEEAKKRKEDVKKRATKARKKPKKTETEEAEAAAPVVADYEEPELEPGALEVDEDLVAKELREFGEGILTGEGAKKLPDGSYRLKTAKREVYYKFDAVTGKWMWQSQTQRHNGEWVETGKDFYDEKLNPDTVIANKISKVLAAGEGILEDEKKPDVAKRSAEILESGKYTTAKRAFMAIYFNPRFYKPEEINEAIDNLSQEKFKRIKAIAEKYKSSGKVPKSALPVVKSSISEEHLYLLLEKLVSFSKLGGLKGATDTLTVQEVLEGVLKNPLADQLEGINAAVLNALKTGDIGDALKAIAIQGIENIQSKVAGMGERLDAVLGISVEGLTENEKIVYREIQAMMLATPTLVKHEPKYVIDNILKTTPKFKGHPKAIELASKFFAEVKKRAPDILERAVKKFEIKKEGLPNHLREGISMDNFLLFSACELVLLDQAIEGEGDEATDLLILGVLIRSIREPGLRHAYIGAISDEITQDIPSIKIPGLKAIRPYFSKAFRLASSQLGYKLLDQMQTYSWYQTQHPTAKSREEMAEAFKNQNVVFGSLKEAAGTTLELSADALATIVLTLGLDEELASCETGKEFLDLIRVKGGKVSTYKDRDGALGILIDTGYEIFLARPGAILYESVSSAIHAEFGDAAKIWVGGSSFFVGAGALRGLFKPYRPPGGGVLTHLKYAATSRTLNAFKGVWWGLKYPIKAPKYALGKAVHLVKGMATGAEAASSMAGAPLRGARRTLNWVRDVRRYGIPGQNVENMVDTGRLLEHHFSKAEKWAPTEATFSARVGRAIRRGQELIRERSTTLRKLAAGDWHWGMSQKYARRFAAQYNDLFGFTENDVFKLDELTTLEKVREVRGANNRLSSLLEKIQEDPKVLDKIKEARKMLKGDHNAFKAELERILKGTKLEPKEIEALAKRMHSERAANQVTEQLERAAGRLKAARATKAGALKGLSQRLRGGPKATADVVRVVELGKGKFRYMGEEISLKPHEIDEVARKMEGNRAKAIEKLCHKKWNTPRLISEGPKGRLYRFRGGEFVLTPAEYKGGDLKQISRICEAKYAESLKITSVRVVKGVPEVKINGKWIKPPKGPDALAKAKVEFAKAAKEAGYSLPYRDLRNAKLLKYWPALKEIAGHRTTLCVGIIYHLETAKDKRKAIAETGVGLAAFWGGIKMGERATRSWTPKSVMGGLGKSGAIFLSGLATAVGVTEPVSELLDKMIPKFTGQQQMSLELIDLFETYTARGLALRVTRKLGTKAGMEMLERKGLGSVAKLLGKKIESKVLKKIITYSSKGILGKLVVSLGARGAVLAALLADDATVIGVIDDVVAVGMAAWMAVDIYDVAELALRVKDIKDAMEEFNKMPIASVEPARVVDQKAIEAALVTRGAKLEELGDNEIMEVIKSIPDIRIKITRQGSSGYEEYRFVKGEVFSTKLMTKEGKILELSDEELNQEITLPPPKEFQTWEIDYSQPKEKLEANYRLAILYTKSECGWTKLDHEIKDDKTIVVKRLDGAQTTTITRSGDKWSVEGYTGGHTLFQALVLANLVNKVHGIFEREGHVGGSSQPFELDDGNVDFDKTWNPNDLRILAAETNWLSFYDKIGVSKQEVVDTLNAWYKAEYKAYADTL